MTGTADDWLRRLWELLPDRVRAQDTVAGEVLGGLLRAVAGELELLDEDLERLYDGWFIETCEDWLVPYVAELVGLTDLPDTGGDVRVFVANEIARRRAKGTVGSARQVVEDITGCRTKAVEYRRNVVTAVHVGYAREGPQLGSVDIRSARFPATPPPTGPGVGSGAFDTMPRVTEVRAIETGAGRWSPANIGFYPFPVEAVAVRNRVPGLLGGRDPRTFTFDPLGRQVPLYVPPVPRGAAHDGLEEYPVPLDAARLDALVSGGGGGLTPLSITVGGEAVGIQAKGHVRPPPGEGAVAEVDPARGTFTLAPAPGESEVRVSYAYGRMAAIGAGEFGRVEKRWVVDRSNVVEGLAAEAVSIEAREEPTTVEITNCTITGDISVGRTEARVDLRVRACDIHAIALADGVRGTVTVTDSVVAGDIVAPFAHVALDGATVAGDIVARTLDTRNSIVQGTATALDRSTGVVRYSYVGPDSRVPRRHAGVTGTGQPGAGPVFVSTASGDPAYFLLAPTTPYSIVRGGERGGEMGVHHRLFRRKRLDAARRHVRDYVPAYLNIGILGS